MVLGEIEIKAIYILVGFDMKMTLHTTTTTTTQTQLPSQGASDQPFMLLKQQHQH